MFTPFIEKPSFTWDLRSTAIMGLMIVLNQITLKLNTADKLVKNKDVILIKQGQS